MNRLVSIAAVILFALPLSAADLNPYKMEVGDIGKLPPGSYVTRSAVSSADLLLEFTAKGSGKSVFFIYRVFDAELEADDTDYKYAAGITCKVLGTRRFRGKTYFWLIDVRRPL